MDAPAERPLPVHVPLVLSLALLAVSSSGVLVRSAAAEPVAIAFWRTFLVAALLLPTARLVSRRDAALVVLSGACLASHFVTWFASLAYIGIMRSTVLVCLGPLWTGLFEWAVLGRRPARGFWTGLALALFGVVVLTGTDERPASLWGDVLATVGGMLTAGYLVIGRDVRARVGIGPYAWLMCATAAALLLPVAWVTGTPVAGFPATTWAILVGLALGPQMLGHNGYNYALRYLPASTVASITLLEPVGATVLAALFLGEIPGPLSVAGGLVAVAGVIVAVRS